MTVSAQQFKFFSRLFWVVYNPITHWRTNFLSVPIATTILVVELKHHWIVSTTYRALSTQESIRFETSNRRGLSCFKNCLDRMRIPPFSILFPLSQGRHHFLRTNRFRPTRLLVGLLRCSRQDACCSPASRS